jgi:multicomponent K+:H+ antiporter subunit A
MENLFLILPLAVCFGSALLSALVGIFRLNRTIPSLPLSLVLALAPLTAFILLASRLNVILEEGSIIQQISWMPTLGIQASLFLDGLSMLFGLLITGIGTLILVYTGYYFKDDIGSWRFLTYMLLFMTSMLGVVLAGDIITLFLFWEGTSITSYLLVAYKYKDPAAQRGAFKALFITGGGGIALLAGLLIMSHVSGSYDMAGILSSGDALRGSPLYLAMFLLVALGAFTKSAQFPFHGWLPDAMSAPTPASAFLHSATMVKAGIYLMARLNPALGFTDTWFWVLSVVGMLTMLSGAYLGLKQNDLKALLAYSTVSQLGVLMMLIGQDTSVAFKALVIGVLAHALYKSALFLIAGIVDHETGTRDLRRLGGIVRAMPFTVVFAGMAALSMAGLPPLFGFLAKETLLATAIHPGARPFVEILFPLSSVIAGALLLAQASMFVSDTFFGRQRDPSVHAHEPPLGMLLAPAVPALISLILGAFPEFRIVALALASAAQAAYGAPVPVSLALWTGINIPLVLSGVAIVLGTTIFAYRARVRLLMALISDRLTLNTIYNGILLLIDGAAYLVTRVQNGKLRFYLATMLLGIGGLLLYFRAMPTAPVSIVINGISFQDELVILQFFCLLLIIVSALASVVVRRDLPAVLALGVSGLAVAVLMVLEPAPDVALVQVVVDILLTIILVLLLARLPRKQRERAAEFTFLQTRPGLIRDGLLAVASGAVMTMMVFIMLTTRPRQSVITPFFEENAYTLVGAADIVGAIIVDFRAFDTLIEIAVFGMGGIGVYTLLHYASRKAGDKDEPIMAMESSILKTLGIGGEHTSPFVQMLAYLILPLTLVISVTHIMFGHNQAGDGFTAGVMISLAVGFWYVVFGYQATKDRLTWLHSSHLIGSGLLIAILGGSIASINTGSFLGHVDFSTMFPIPLPEGFHLSTSLLFEIAICLTVLGSASLVIDTVGRPRDDDEESKRKVREIDLLARRGVVTSDEPQETTTR